MTAGSCRDMVAALLDELPASGWSSVVRYSADGSDVLGWAFETTSRTGRRVEVSYDDDFGQLRLQLAATGLLRRGHEQTWDDVRDLAAVRDQLRPSLAECLDR